MYYVKIPGHVNYRKTNISSGQDILIFYVKHLSFFSILILVQ